MSFLKSLYTVLELDSSEEEAAPSAPKRARTCDADDADASSNASTAGTIPVAPLFLNKLQESSEDHSDRSGLLDHFLISAYCKHILCFFGSTLLNSNVPKGLT